MNLWRITDDADALDVERSLAAEAALGTRGPDRGVLSHSRGPAIAVRLHDLQVHNNRKWFDLLGGARARVDVVVVQGNFLDGDAGLCYVPKTFRFEDVKDEDRLPTDDRGLLAYYGWPRHFLDLSIIVSRDRGDSDDLADLLTNSAGDPDMQAATATLARLAVADPPAAAIVGAMSAAAALGDMAYKAVKAVSGKTIGLYRGNRLAYPDDFGVGRNPADGAYRERDLSFWYEVVRTSEPIAPGLR